MKSWLEISVKMTNRRMFRMALVIRTLLAVVSSIKHHYHGRFEDAIRMQRMREEALNVSHYAEELVKRIRTMGLVKHGVPDIYNIVEHLQRYGDERRVKKYMIKTLDDL